MECGVGVARSSLNTTQKQRARGGNKREIREAGEGLYARRRFKKGEVILDYAYMNGLCGEKVDHLNKEERWRRYPARPGNPDGIGEYLLEVGNGWRYLDAHKKDIEIIQEDGKETMGGLRIIIKERCGLGGKVNTNPGKQNARFKGSKIYASRGIRHGEEIFIPYRP